MDFEALARIIASELRKEKALLYSHGFDSMQAQSPDSASFWLNKAIQCLANAAASVTNKRFPIEKFDVSINDIQQAQKLLAEIKSKDDFLWQSEEIVLMKKVFDGDENRFIDCISAWCAVNDPNEGGTSHLPKIGL